MRRPRYVIRKKRLSRIPMLTGLFLLLISSIISAMLTGWLIRSVFAANSNIEPPIAESQPAPVNPSPSISPVPGLTGTSQAPTLPSQPGNRPRPKAKTVQKQLTNTVPQQFQGAVLDSAELKIARDAIALTFDDGPWPRTTDQVLDILAEEDIKATFFWVGQAIKDNPKIAQRVVNEGHSIANHTWNHRYHTVGPAEAAQEIGTTAQIMQEVTGASTKLFRPPGGYLNNGLADYAKSQGYTVVMWSVSSSDTDSTLDARDYANNVLSEAKPGGIVLLHDGGGDRTKTVAALPVIIRNLKAQGYRFVTVPELLKLQSDGW